MILRTGPYPWQAVSLFVDAQQWPAAERVAGQIRVNAARARRFGTRDQRSASDREQ
jgi:hypothetical protein